MKRASQILRERKARARKQNRFRLLAKLGLSIVMTLLLAALLTSAAVGVMLHESASGLPQVSKIEGQFGPRGAEKFHPMIVLDRSGEHLLWENIHPLAAQARWLKVRDIPEHAVQAALQAIDPTFWSNPGYPAGGIATLLSAGAVDSLTLRLAKTALQPAGDSGASDAVREIRARLLASELTRQYAKEQILAWFLNSANYGPGIYGIDAAAHAYLDKSGAELTLAESAILASLLKGGEQSELREASIRLLGSMRVAKLIGADEYQQARAAVRRIDLTQVEAEADGLHRLVWQQVENAIGPWVSHRSGLRVTTTLDLDLQNQAECAARSQIERISGGSAGAILPVEDGSTCVAATLLPALRPKDAGLDHGVDEFGALVTDPASGEILALVGDPWRSISPGSTLTPFVYLTAFTKGSGPGSMVLDIGDPSEIADPQHGPVRMRTALNQGYRHALLRTLRAVGKEDLIFTLRQMGVAGAANLVELSTVEIAHAEHPLPVMEMAQAYGVIANAGVGSADGLTAIRSVEEIDGGRLYSFEPLLQAVVSPELAYLLIDVLASSQAPLLQIGRPAGWQASAGEGVVEDKAVGFTPQRLGFIWFAGQNLRGMDLENGSAAVLHAVLRFSTKDLRHEGWTPPVAVIETEVCDPSGLLPTPYCPEVVREVFIQGTEPTHYDNLYLPFRINRETGKLATLFTPLELIDEQIFFIPPPGAQVWAQANGRAQPPVEYDTLYEKLVTDPRVDIRAPAPFATIRGRVAVMGEARSSGMEFYRLQYGQGLDPSQWVQIGEDAFRTVAAGRLGLWDTDGLNGLYTLQLVAVSEEGEVKTAAIPVAVDNTPPAVRLLSPLEGLQVPRAEQIRIQVEAEDDFGVSRVEIQVDGRTVAELMQAPFVYLWQTGNRARAATIQALAYDQAGNMSTSPVVTVEVVASGD